LNSIRNGCITQQVEMTEKKTSNGHDNDDDDGKEKNFLKA